MTNDVDFVADLPDEGPIISGGFPRYHIGDKVEVNCTSKRSKPAAKLKWYINGEQADQNVVKKYKVSFSLFDKMITGAYSAWVLWAHTHRFLESTKRNPREPI